MTEKKKPAKKGQVEVECICANVHLGDKYGQKVLRAYRESDRDNWSKGDRATIDAADADFLIDRGQVKKV